MKAGLDLQALAAELQAQHDAKDDFVCSTEELTLLTPPIPDDKAEPRSRPEISVPGGNGEYALSEIAARQIADRVGIPWKLWQRFENDHPDMLDYNVNNLFRREPKQRMIRTFDWSKTDGRGDAKIARACLSDRYRRLDNDELCAYAIFPALADLDKAGAKVVSSQITDKKLYVKVLLPKIEGEIKRGDIVQAGIVFENSEVGRGALTVKPLIYRLVCTNGMIAPAGVGAGAQRQLHLGRAMETDETFAVLTDEARQADDKALWLKLRDVTRAAASETVFNDLVARMRETVDTPAMREPTKGIERLAKRLDLGDGEREGVFAHLIEGGDLTAYGALNAVTRFSQDVESYDRATDLEEAGGKILAMVAAGEWEAIAA